MLQHKDEERNVSFHLVAGGFTGHGQYGASKPLAHSCQEVVALQNTVIFLNVLKNFTCYSRDCLLLRNGVAAAPFNGAEPRKVRLMSQRAEFMRSKKPLITVRWG